MRLLAFCLSASALSTQRDSCLPLNAIFTASLSGRTPAKAGVLDYAKLVAADCIGHLSEWKVFAPRDLADRDYFRSEHAAGLIQKNRLFLFLCHLVQIIIACIRLAHISTAQRGRRDSDCGIGSGRHFACFLA